MLERLPLFSQALNQAQDAVLITDADLDEPGPRILFANHAFLRMTGYAEAELLGRTPRLLQGSLTDRSVLDELRRCLASTQHFAGTVVNYRKDGTPFEIEWHASPIFDDHGLVTHYLSIHRDVTERKRFDQEIEHYIQQLVQQRDQQQIRQHELEHANKYLRSLAVTDRLTGLYNHRHFHETLGTLMTTEAVVSLVLLDVDHFKAFNDTYGHPAGDVLLQTLAHILLGFLGPSDLAARYGGEEFAIVLPESTEDDALAMAERVRATVEKLCPNQHTITVSLGVSTVRAEAGAEHTLVELADRALYAAKSQGRNRIRHHRHLQHTVQSGSVCVDQCAPSPSGCLRCELMPDGRNGRKRTSGAALLLGPQDKDADTALRRALAEGNFTCTEIGPTLVVRDVRDRLAELSMLFKDRLSPYARSCIRAAYAPRGVETVEEALASFLFAESLSKMLEHAEHEWVRDALAEEWLFSVFHPIVNAKTGEVFAQEALLRARNPRDGRIIGAGPIIDACHALNLQHQLDQRARQVAIRTGAIHVPNSMRLFINFLPNTIYDPEICLRTAMETARACGMPLSQIVFEVVETERIPDLDHLCRILDYYRACGVGTAVDDMGAGFTNVEYLSALRPDYVKLDREVVVAAEHSTAARQKLDQIVKAARDIGSAVIAEGIETHEQFALCTDVGVDYMQGFLFAKPACPPQPVHFPITHDRLAV